MYSLAAATIDETHSWIYGVRWMGHVFGGGRCGGAAPAQGRAEGPTAQKAVVSDQWLVISGWLPELGTDRGFVAGRGRRELTPILAFTFKLSPRFVGDFTGLWFISQIFCYLSQTIMVSGRAVLTATGK